MERKKIIGSENRLLACRHASVTASVLRRLHFTVYASLITVFLTLLFTLYSSRSLSFAADKLVVKDSEVNTKFVVTEDGKVGIGMEAAIAQLGVTSETIAGRGLNIYQQSSDQAGGAIFMRKSRGSRATPSAINDQDYIGGVGFMGHSGSNWIATVSFGARVNGTVTSTSVPTEFFISTSSTNDNNPFANGTVRLLINSIGNVGLGTTNPQHLLDLGGGAYSDGTNWYTGSSREYKENIRELTTEEAVLAFNKLNPVTFNYKIDKEGKHAGFIAEDVPDLVASKDRKGLSSMDIVAVLTRVVQEQQKTISDLSEKIKKLEQIVK